MEGSLLLFLLSILVCSLFSFLNMCYYVLYRKRWICKKETYFMDGKFIKIFVESGFIVALLYFSTTAVLDGYCDYWGITDMITYQLDYSMMVRAAFILILLVVVALFSCTIGEIVISEFETWKNKKIIAIFILFAVLVIAKIVRNILLELNFNGLIPAIIGAMLIGFIEICPIFVDNKHGKNMTICLLGFLLCLVTTQLYQTNYDMGMKGAAFKTEYMMLCDSDENKDNEEDKQGLALIYHSGDIYIFAPMTEKGEIQREYTLYSVDDLSGKTMVSYEVKTDTVEENE